MAHLTIPKDYFKMEIREGFPVGELMKRNWAAQLQVLEDVRELCTKHDIKWFAYSGTLLGAVRHKGFIPWDDDIDICMVGEDFIKFLYYVKDELDERYLHLSPYDRGSWDQRTIFRIANTEYLTFDKEHLDEWQDCPLAIGTDVFPFYYVPREKREEEYILELLRRIESLYQLNDYCVKHLKQGDAEVAKSQQDIIAASMIGLQQDTGFEFTADRPLANQLCMLFDQVCRFTTEEEADYVVRYNSLMRYGDAAKLPKELFYEQIELPFETVMVPSPKNYDFFLKWQYGDEYMTPYFGGGGHNYPYFSKQIRMFQNRFEIYDWSDKQGDPEHIKCENPKKQSLSESKNDKCVVLYYTSIRELMIYGEYVVAKIKDLLAYFEAHKDSLSLYWCPGAFIDHSGRPDVPPFERIVPELIDEYKKLIEDYKASGLGICDETGELNKAIDTCDMYYGDEGLLMDMFATTGKPVFVQDYHFLWNEDKKDNLPDTEKEVTISLAKHPQGGKLFETPIDPEFGDAAFVKDGKGYAMSSNMNGLFRIDKNLGTCEYLYFIKGEKATAHNLYSKAVPFEEKIIFIPGAANNLVIYNPTNNTYKEFNVFEDTYIEWANEAKYADCVTYEGLIYLFGERYTNVLRINPETGEIKKFETGRDGTVWMRHSAFREGGLVHLVSATSTEYLTFNLRTEKLFIQDSYSKKKVEPILVGLSKSKDEQSLKNVKLNLASGFNVFLEGSFNSYDAGKGMIIRETEDWLSFADIIKYVEWKKEK